MKKVKPGDHVVLSWNYCGACPSCKSGIDSYCQSFVTINFVAVAPGTEVTLDMDMIMNDRTVKGIIKGDSMPDLFIPALIDLYVQGRLPYDRLVKYFSFDEINKAAEDMEKGIVIRPILKP